MAMGGPYNHNKVGNSSNNSSSNRGRPYGLMLLLAFGAALVGVMVLHKLKERRIFNLVIKEKDTQLVSLHLALQKERDYSREVKMKHEELKAKMYSIRTQKMQLERTVSEMKSTIGSLKEELRTMEAAFEEKQNETKVMELVESLKQKEAEMEELKHRLDYKVWSVSADDPSNPTGNLTMSRRREVADQVSSEDRNANKSMNVEQGETRKEVDDQTGYADGETKLDDFKDVNVKNGNTTEDVQASKNQSFEEGDHRVENSELGDGEKIEVNKERGMKLEMQEEGSESRERSKAEVKQDYFSGVKGKKWRSVARNKRMDKKGSYGNNGVARMRGTRFFEDDQFKGRAEEAASNRRLTSDDRSVQAREFGDLSNAEDLDNKNTDIDTTHGNDKASGTESVDTKQELEVENSEDPDAVNIQKNLSSKDIVNEEDADTHDFPGDMEIAEAEEQDNDVPEDGFFGESGFNLEDREEYKEEIDASEF